MRELYFKYSFNLKQISITESHHITSIQEEVFLVLKLNLHTVKNKCETIALFSETGKRMAVVLGNE